MVGSRVVALAGRLNERRDRRTEAVGRRVAPLSNRLLAAVDRPTTLAARLAPELALAACLFRLKGAAAGPAQGARPGAAVMVGMREPDEIGRNLKRYGEIKGQIANLKLGSDLAARLGGTLTVKPERTLAMNQGRRKLRVGFGRTPLSGPLNRGDRLVSSRRLVSSDGEAVQIKAGLTGGPVWHRGVTVVKVGGAERTITHLRRMQLPPTNLYFDRRLSDAETADIITGQVKPRRIDGYAGSISSNENLVQPWARAKTALILTRLHWPTNEPEPENRWQPV